MSQPVTTAALTLKASIYDQACAWSISLIAPQLKYSG
jgi:hypothetical protein